MTRALRGAWSRRWTSLPLLLLTVIVVAGTTAVLAISARADTSAALAVPLLVLGLVAVPATARELAVARRGELALARLRGVQGGQLSALAGVEPVVVLVLGGVVGLGLGDLLGRVALATLLPPAAVLPVRDDAAPQVLVSGLAGLAIVVVGLVAVLLGTARTLGEPLADQVRTARRPRSAGPAGLAVAVLTVVAAVVATYRAAVTDGDPDLLVLAAPALVGLAVGQAAVAGLQGAARLLVGATRRRGLGGFLAVRRLARVADVVGPVRLVVATAGVATVAITGAVQVSSWADETARLRAGGPAAVTVVDGQVGTALTLSEVLDPDGRWLMAAAVVPGEGSVPARRAYLDLSRYDAVLGDFYAGTPVAAVEPAMHDLVQVSGRSGGTGQLEVGVSGVSSRAGGTIRVQVVVTYTGSGVGDGATVLGVDVPADGSRVTAGTPLPRCACTLTGIEVTRATGTTSPLPFVVDEIDFGGTDALDLDWLPGDPDPDTDPDTDTDTDTDAAIQQVDGGLLVPDARGELTASPAASDSLPVIATTSATWDGSPTAESPGGDDRAAVLVGRADALPLVEADGLLLDLPTAESGAAPTVPAAEVSIVLAADTPADVRRRVEQAAGGPATTLAQVRDATVARTRAGQAAVYVVMAGACLLIALLTLVTAYARQRAAWRRDLAALRLVGTGRAGLVAAARVEVLLLALTAAVGTLVGGVLAVRLLLEHLALVVVPDHAVALRTAVAVGPTTAGVAAAALVVLLAVGWGRTVGHRHSRPAILRDEGGAL